VYWMQQRAADQPFAEQHPAYGTVYRVGSRQDMIELLKREKGMAWTAHPRIKASSWTPDIFRNEDFYLDNSWLGAAWKAMPGDLSRPKLGERGLDLLDDMSNWGQRKQLLGEVDVFKIDRSHELYGHMNVNYVRLPRLPRYDEGWQPVMDAFGPIDYAQLNTILDDGHPRGALNYWKSSFLAGLTDEAIDTMVECYARCPSPMSQLLLEHFHGVATRVPVSETACPHRTPGYNFLVLCQWSQPADTLRCVQWARDTYQAMRPFMAATRYVNYLNDDEDDNPAVAAYGPNYQRLRAIKTKYDPMNVFHLNQNIPPA